MRDVEIPERLLERLRRGQLKGAVEETLSAFAPWLSKNELTFFPDFTDHGPRHVTQVLESAEWLMDDAAWQAFSAEDAGCLILAVLLHDIAMHLSGDGFRTLIAGGAGWSPRGEFLHAFRGEPSWSELWQRFEREFSRWDAAKLQRVLGSPEPPRFPPLSPPHGWDESQRRIIGEFMRRHHARLAHEIAIAGVPGPTEERIRFADVHEYTNWEDLPGFVARSHNLPLREAVDLLEQTQQNSRKLWCKVHVPYVMALLRIADYIQLDATRAPRELLKVHSLKSPLSKHEWEKHGAVRDMRPHQADPGALFIEANPKDARTFFGLKQLFEDVQREIDQCWNVLGETYGSSGELGLRLRRITSNLDDAAKFAQRVSYAPVDARFRVSSGEVLKLLVGPLYGNDPDYGVRELMQNSLDACRELEDWKTKNPGRVVDVDAELVADVVVLVEEHSDQTQTFTIADRGIGMSLDVITNYFLVAGASFRNSATWVERHAVRIGGNGVLRSGRFGIGALAGFLLGDEMEVTTRAVESASGYQFACRLGSELIEIRHCQRPVGTTIKIRMKQRVSSRGKLADLDYAADGRRPTSMAARRWYFAERPSLAYGVRYGSPGLASSSIRHSTKDLAIVWENQASLVPACAAPLPPHWWRVSSSEFDDIQWSPWRLEERVNWRFGDGDLFCNGIVIPRAELAARGPHGHRTILPPRVSVWDSRALLPLTIRRDELCDELQFHNSLEVAVCRDILACWLVGLSGTTGEVWRQFTERRRGAPHHPRHGPLAGFARCRGMASRSRVIPRSGRNEGCPPQLFGPLRGRLPARSRSVRGLARCVHLVGPRLPIRGPK
jgi:molecular chaperone HtpG